MGTTGAQLKLFLGLLTIHMQITSDSFMSIRHSGAKIKEFDGNLNCNVLHVVYYLILSVHSAYTVHWR